ncbi:two-component sensor histidine kinase [Polymorphobacter multimanifer]|uniref:histidine kinase n=1 Tax=Polymorphobacter multimanifer TaxID=1070431 RepID=A0A841L4V1_9SPHN|nr:ATP-binding protein [Polymorphobacter multimanifer]MBB6227654.1 two-component system C4-dicarboxylate transport sensor histidine kinase DctB [Polymorphobacter multimanifer]GGI75194.1 two-component sensor histidine kinase [Polymorphobacter multimanifer]
MRNIVFGLFVVAVATWIAGVVAARNADAALVRQASISASLFEAVLQSALERFRALPLVLASDGDVRGALGNSDRDVRHRLDLKLARLAERTSAAAIYVIDPRGRTIAASNSETPESFVGREFSFRSYFAAAMRNGSGEQFALGNTTHRPGLYLSSRVDSDGKALGVVVTKIDFSSLETEWRSAQTPVFVTGADGVVLITSVEAWRFKQAAQLPIRPLASGDMLVSATLPGRRPADFVAINKPITIPGWTLTVLRTRDIGGAVAAARALTLLASALCALGLWAILRRRNLAIAARAAAQLELEAKVASRTRALSKANSKLTSEIAERRRAEAALLLLHLELEQANRLTILGQVAAGVTHEINQPVAAISTWAHNATVFLARSDTASATTALATIVALTERIGRITGELRDFARKSDGAIACVRVDDAIDGALMLVSAHQQQSGVRIKRRAACDLAVIADRVRLEQVLVNLLQNALEAVEADLEGACVFIEAARSGKDIMLSVTDTGPGVAPEIAASLFTPFQTSKARGLGLGLVISRDICRALGGDLRLLPTGRNDGRGATFAVTLPAAQGMGDIA